MELTQLLEEYENVIVADAAYVPDSIVMRGAPPDEPSSSQRPGSDVVPHVRPRNV